VKYKQSGDLEAFAIRIKQLRESLNMTQKEFANTIQSTVATISAYENITKNPSLGIIINIAKIYNVSIDWLCGLSEKMRNDGTSQTYADAINLFVEAKNAVGFEIDTKQENCIIIHDGNMRKFLGDWGKMLSLLQNESIDNKLYELWLDSKKKEYENFRIENET